MTVHEVQPHNELTAAIQCNSIVLIYFMNIFLFISTNNLLVPFTVCSVGCIANTE
jgi:hypothetical protein